jgi:uncharacterized membrane protein
MNIVKEKYFSWVKVLAFFGILLAAYLLWQQFYQPEFKPCNINAWVNCDAVITGPVAKTLGIPTPLYGFVGYIVILFAAFWKKAKLVLGMATFGLAFCLYIGYIELVQLRVICPVCIACQLIMISVFVLGILLNKKKTSGDDTVAGD